MRFYSVFMGTHPVRQLDRELPMLDLDAYGTYARGLFVSTRDKDNRSFWMQVGDTMENREKRCIETEFG